MHRGLCIFPSRYTPNHPKFSFKHHRYHGCHGFSLSSSPATIHQSRNGNSEIVTLRLGAVS